MWQTIDHAFKEMISLTRPLRYALMASGSGSTAEKIVKACMEGGILHGLIDPVCLIVSRADAGVIERIRALNPWPGDDRVEIVEPRNYHGNQFAFGEAILEILECFTAHWYGQHGWIPLTPGNVVRSRFHGLNQHPAPLPHFGGQGMYAKAPHSAVLYFAKVSGLSETAAVAHLVTENFDEGGVIAQTPVPILRDDTVDRLQQRVLHFEADTQIQALLRIVASDGQPPKPEPSIIRPFQNIDCDILKLAKENAIREYPHG